MYEQWHPLGVVGVISAFNFPVAVWSWNAFLAAICGNATVWKPSPKTALCSLAVQRICNRVLERHSLPAIFQLFIDAGTELARGSSTTGASRWCRSPARRTSAGRSRCASPSGSARACSSSAATTPSSSMKAANLDLAVPAIVFGAVGTAGQRCTTTRRVLVHRSRAAELERRLVARLRPGAHRRSARPAHADGPADRCGRGGALPRGHRGGAGAGGDTAVRRRRAAPGRAISSSPRSCAPPPGMPIVHTETFAPILYLMTYEQLRGGHRRCRMPCPTDCPRPCSPTGCRWPSAS